MKKIRLTKLAAAASPLSPTPEKNDFIPGEYNEGKSLPIDYYVEGTIEHDPEVGKALTVLRTNRNGVNVLGITTTSKITKWDGVSTFETLNSVYKIEYIGQDDFKS